MRLKYYLLLFAFITFLSCEEKKTVENNSKIEKPHLIDLTSLRGKELPLTPIESIKLLKINIDTLHLITHIDKVFYHQHKIFVVDSKIKAINVLDTLGNFLYKIGSIGEGPGEYSSIHGVAIDKTKEELLLFSMEKRKMISYSLEGSFLAEKAIPLFIYDFLVQPNGELAVFLNNNGDEINNSNLLILDKNYTTKEKFFTFNSNEPAISFSGGLSPTDDGFLYASALSDTIFQYTSPKLFPKYILKFEGKKIPPDYQVSISKKMDFLTQNMSTVSYASNGFMKLNQFLFLPYSEKSKIKFLIYDDLQRNIYTEEFLVANHIPLEVLSWDRPFVGIKDENTIIGLIDSEKVAYLKKNQPDFMQRLRQTPYYEEINQMKDDNDIILAFITFK